MKNSVVWDITPCGSCNKRLFGGTCRVHIRSVLRLLVIAGVVPNSPILVTLIIEAIR
jgi:hypothetical protein